MVDIPAPGTTVVAMSTTTMFIVVGILLAGIGATVATRIIGRKAAHGPHGETLPDGRADGDTDAAANSQRAGATRDPRVERISEAYENGEIDERMIGTAARVLGISTEEARRRLDGAATAQGTASVGGHDRSKTRAKNRKKNKQSKRSRQANRR